MNRRMAALVTGLTLVLAILFSSQNRSMASFQSGSPQPETGKATPAAIVVAISDLPADLAVQLLGSADISGLPNSGVLIQLDRILLSNGDSFAEMSSGNQLIAIEQGTLTATIDNQTLSVNSGGSILVAPGSEVKLANIAAQEVSLLRITLSEDEGLATPVASPVAGVTPQLLAAGEGNRLVSRRGTLFIAQLTIPAGASTGEQMFTGPVAISVESGEVTVHQDNGSDLTLTSGFGGVTHGFSHVNVENKGPESASLTVAGLLAPVTGAAVGPTPMPTVKPTTGPDIVATAQAENASLVATIEGLQTQVASSESANATAVAFQSEVQTSLDSANAELTSVNADLTNANATISAQETGIAAAEATQTASAGTIASVIAANAERSKQLDEAEKTIRTQQDDLAAADAEIAAQSDELDAANATATAQAGVIRSQVTEAAKQVEILTSVVAIVESKSNELDAASATLTAQSVVIENANATATAQSAALDAANVTATAQAGTLESADANATAAAQAAAATQSANEASAAAYEATIAAAQTAYADTQATLTAKSVELTSADATIIALSTAQANVESVAVASLNPQYIDLTVNINVGGILAGDKVAIENAQKALNEAFKPFAGCRAGVVLTFGHGDTIGQGTKIAAALNAVIQKQYPEIFGGAAFDAFGNLNPTYGDVDIRIYFFSGCPAAE